MSTFKRSSVGYMKRGVLSWAILLISSASVLILGHKQRNRLLFFLKAQYVQLQVADGDSCPVIIVPNVDARQYAAKARWPRCEPVLRSLPLA